jgi:hypothetical protein
MESPPLVVGFFDELKYKTDVIAIYCVSRNNLPLYYPISVGFVYEFFVNWEILENSRADCLHQIRTFLQTARLTRLAKNRDSQVFRPRESQNRLPQAGG